MDNTTIHNKNNANTNNKNNTSDNANINKDENTADTNPITKIKKKNITTIIAEHAGHYDDHEYLNLFDLYDIMD